MPRSGAAARILLGAVRVYQIVLSPLFGGSCRYIPSCSQYTAEAIQRFGALRGTWLGVRRLSRCHPFGSSGFDPVPDVHPGSNVPVKVHGSHAPRECPR